MYIQIYILVFCLHLSVDFFCLSMCLCRDTIPVLISFDNLSVFLWVVRVVRVNCAGPGSTYICAGSVTALFLDKSSIIQPEIDDDISRD